MNAMNIMIAFVIIIKLIVVIIGFFNSAHICDVNTVSNQS